MRIEIAAVGGYGESGRNMVALRLGDDVVLCDMGLHLPNYIKLNEEESEAFAPLSESRLKRADAIPRDGSIKDWREDVRAIVITHGHLDHIGAAPYIAPKYDAPIYCSPFAAAILRGIIREDKLDVPNEIIEVRPGRKVRISKDVVFECIHATHSTPQTMLAGFHTPEGLVVYANDYKMDDKPTLGKPIDRRYLKELGRGGVFALIQDCLYADAMRHTPSESIAKDMLEDVLLDLDHSGHGLIVTTFASHIARLKSIAECGRKMGRKVVFIGRSFHKYCSAARNAGVTDLFKKAKIVKYARQASRLLKQIEKRKQEYLLVVSGHQGEPQSVLSKMLDGIYSWNFERDDRIVFSSSVIPADINRAQRAAMDEKLKAFGVRIFDNVHVSGHSSREDIRDIIHLLRPEHVLPAHGEDHHIDAFKSLAQEEGFVDGKTLHILHNGERVVLKED